MVQFDELQLVCIAGYCLNFSLNMAWKVIALCRCDYRYRVYQHTYQLHNCVATTLSLFGNRQVSALSCRTLADVYIGVISTRCTTVPVAVLVMKTNTGWPFSVLFVACFLAFLSHFFVH